MSERMHDLAVAMGRLAKARSVVQQAESMDRQAKDELYGTTAWKLSQEASNLVSSAREEEREADKELRALAVAMYKESGVKKLAPGVKIKLMKRFSYEQQDAISYCVSYMPKAIRLDKVAFERRADGLSFVNVSDVPVATISETMSQRPCPACGGGLGDSKECPICGGHGVVVALDGDIPD
jgi:hypothetical protein